MDATMLLANQTVVYLNRQYLNNTITNTNNANINSESVKDDLEILT